MNVPSKAELLHLKIQAAMRENIFSESQMKYLGMQDHKHWYLIDGKHKVSTDQLEEFEIHED